MQQGYNFNSVFGGDDKYKSSFLRESTRLHLFYNSQSSEEDKYNESEDRYRGFFSNFFEDQVRGRASELGYEDKYLITKEALFDNAAYQLKNSLVSSTNSTYRKVFSIFEVKNLFDNEDDDNKFSQDLLNDFASYIIKPRSERESEDILPSLRQIDYTLDQAINRDIVSSVSATANIRRDIEGFKARAYSVPSAIDEITAGGFSRSQKLIQQSGYVSRPGIMPAVGIMHDAESSLSINIFQLQNKSVLDYYTDDILRRVHSFREATAAGGNPEKFTLNVNLAYPTETAQDSTTYTILGMNAIAARRFERLKELYGEDAININVSYSDRKNHAKFLVSDNLAIIGTQNLTNPIGKSLYQSGSNYEALRMLQFKVDGYTSNNIEQALKEGTIKKEDLTSETLLYMQARSVMNRINRDPKGKFLSTGQGNVGGPMETMQLLRNTLDYADSQSGKSSNTKISAILDQVFLLQHESTIFSNVRAGEMGPEALEILNAKESHINKKAKVYQGMQTQFLDMLIEGRANAFVDVRNYRKNVQDPIFTRLNEIGILQQYDYNVENLIRKAGATTGSAQERIQKLSQFGLDESMSRQILAMTSGNIQTAAVPRQHVKAFLAYEGELIRPGRSLDDYKFLSGTLGSSNLGLYSLGLGDEDIDKVITNFELNLLYADDKIRDYYTGTGKNILKQFDSAFSLDKTKETEELREYAAQFFSMVADVATRKVGQMTYTDVNNRAEYEREVDRKRVMELYDSLDKLSKSTGTTSILSVNLEYDTKGPIALQVSVANSLTYKLTALNSGSGNNPGFIYEINKGKVIGFSDFVNSTEEDIRTGFQRNGVNVTISAGERMQFSPIETTTSLLSSIALESEQVRLIRAPLTEYQTRYAPGLDGNYDFTTGAAKYLLQLAGKKGSSLDSITDPNRVGKGDLVYGALRNLQIRLQTSDTDLDRIRSLAGIDINSNQRRGELTYLTDLIQIYGKSNETDRYALLTGQGLQGRDSIYKYLSSLLSNPQYADLMYDFIQAQDDPLYRRSVNDHIKEISNKGYDPYLLRTQVNTYGYTQAIHQKPLYGIGKRRGNFRDVVNDSALLKEESIRRLSAFALASSPYEYDPTTDLGKGDAIYVRIAEGGGSSEKTGLENYDYYKYSNLLPYASHKKIGDVTSLKILADAGVGSTIRVSDQEAYRKSISHLGEGFANEVTDRAINTIRQFGSDDELLMFNFDTSKKASQIPQRIKNVIGSRPLMELSGIYQTLIDHMKPVMYNSMFGRGSSPVTNSVDLQNAYLTDLRSQLGDKAGLLHEGYGIGALYEGKIRSNLSHDLALELEAIRKQVEDEFGVDTEDGKLGSEIFRVRLLQIDSQGSGSRGFIGSSQRHGHSVMLFQLGGAYSDYSFLNPHFGGEDGMRQGFIDRAVKGQQASKLIEGRFTGDSEGWSFLKNLKISSGDVMSLDYASSKVYVNRYDSETGEYKKQTVIDSRKEFLILTNLIDRVDSDPSFTNLKGTSNAASFTSESAREVIRELRILEANPDSNEIKIEMVLDRTILPGTRRLESMSGGLLKLNPLFLYGEFFPELIDQFNKNKGGAFTNYDLSKENVMGIVNPSNLKSYFFQHGATILTGENGNLLKGLLNDSSSNIKSLAASLLMTFGVDRFNRSNLSSQALETLARQASTGELGDYFKDQYTLIYLQEGIKKGGNPTLASIGEAFVKGASPGTRDKAFSDLQVRTLGHIGLDNIINALNNPEANGSVLLNKLKEMLTDSTGEVLKKEYLDTGVDRGRELALLAGTLDMFSQMTKAKVNNINVLDATQDRSAYLALGSIGGKTYEELIERQDELSHLVNSLATKSYTIGAFLSAAAGQSKVTFSSKKESFIENQHIIWEPFYNNIKKFQSGGSVDALRQLTAGFFGAGTGAYTGEFLEATQKMQVLDVLDPYVRSPVFKAKMMGVYSSPFTTDSQFNAYKQTYEMYGVLQMLLNSDGFSYTAENKRVVENIIRGYDKTNKETENSLLRQIQGETTISAVRSIIEQGYVKSIRRLEDVSQEFKHYANRDPGTGMSEAQSTGIQRSAGNQGRFGFSFPLMEFLDDGRVRFHKDYKEYSMSLAGEDTKLLGESFGGFENQLLKDQILIWEALAEGSLIGKTFDAVANTASSVVELDLNDEVYMQLIKFRETANLYPYQLQKSLGEAALQKIFGHGIGFEGGTTTPAAMFLGSSRAAILPESVLQRHEGSKPNRRAVHANILELINSNATSKNNLINSLNTLKVYSNKEKQILRAIESRRTEVRNQPDDILQGRSINEALDDRHYLLNKRLETEDNIKVLEELQSEYLRAEYTRDSNTHTLLKDYEENDELGSLREVTNRERKPIKNNRNEEYEILNRNKKIRQALLSPFIQNIKSINTELTTTTQELETLRRSQEDLRVTQLAPFLESVRGISEVYQKLNSEISILFDRKQSLIDERKYIDNVLTNKEPRSPNSVGRFSRSTLIKSSDTIQTEINLLQLQINEKLNERKIVKNQVEEETRTLTLMEESTGYAALNNNINSVEDYLNSLKQQKAEAKGQLQSFQKLSGFRHLNLEIENSTEIIKQLNLEYSQKVQELKGIDSWIYTVQTRINEQENNAYRSSLNIELQRSRREKENLSKEIKHLNGLIQEAESSNPRLQSLNSAYLAAEGNLELTKQIIKENHNNSVQELELLNSNKRRKFIRSTISMLEEGVSSVGGAYLETLQKSSAFYQNQLTEIKSRFSSELNQLSSINEQLKQLRNSIDSLSTQSSKYGPLLNQLAIEESNLINKKEQLLKQTGISTILGQLEGTVKSAFNSIQGFKSSLTGTDITQGDSVVNLLGLYETETIRNEFLKLGYSSEEDYQGKKIYEYTEFTDSLKHTPSVIRGLMIGSSIEDSNRAFVSPQELQGKLNPANSVLEMLGINSKELSKMSITEAESILRRGIDSAETFTRDREAALRQEHSQLMGDDTQNRFNDLYASLNRFRNILDNRNSAGVKQGIDHSDIEDVSVLLNGELQKFHSEIALKYQTNRPAPLGGPFLGLSQFDIFGLKDLNHYMEGLGLPISFTPLDGSSGRNSTAHIVNPISMLQSQLGDFDGDMMINIKNTSDEFKYRKAGYDSQLIYLKQQKSQVEYKLRDASDYYGEDPKLVQQLDSLNKRIDTYTKASNDLSTAIARVESNSEYSRFQEAAAKYVGNYLKVDYRMFLGAEHNGYAKETVDPSVMFTFIEQGRGLFGGMKDILVKGNEASASSIYDSLLQLARHKDSLNTAEAFDGLLTSLDPNGNKLYELLRDGGSGISTEIRKELIEATKNEDGVEAGVANLMGRLYAAQAGTETIQSFNAKGLFGTAMSRETFEGMTKTLAQAGSIILGKTYNTMQGMLFTEAPTLALSYAILNDPNGELEEMMKQTYGTDEGNRRIEDMKSAALASRAKSEQMGAFLQATQQILRDSIKPKNAEGYLNNLDAAIADYKTAKDSGAQGTIDKAYEKLVEAFGPGSGLKSLMQMEYLIKDFDELKVESDKEGDIIKKAQLLSKYDLTEDRTDEYLTRLGYDKKKERFTDENLNKLGVSKELIVAAYKTKQDLVSMVTSFAYEKAMEEDKSGAASSTGRGLLGLFEQGIEQHEQRGKWDTLVKGAQTYFKTNTYSDLNEEQAAYVDTLKQRGIKDSSDYSGMSESQKLYHAHVYLEGKGQILSTSGKYGEGLIDFAQFNKVRSNVYANRESREVSNSFDITTDPLAVIDMMAATSGKIEPHMIGKAMSTLVNAARSVSGEVNPSQEDVAKYLLGGGSLNETPQDRQMKAIFLDMAAKNKKGFEYLLKTTASMAFGQQTSTVKALTDSAAYESSQTSMSEENLKKHFLERGLGVEEAEQVAKVVSHQYLQGLNDEDASIQQLANAAITRGRAKPPTMTKKVGSVLGSLGKDSDVKSQAFIFPLLGIIGQALASGDLNPEMFQQAVGTTIANLSYVRFTNLEGSWKEKGIAAAANVGAGTSFKMRLALEEHQGDAGKAILQTVSQDVTMALVSQTVSPYIAKRLDKAFGGVDSLNFDKYESTRGLLTSMATSVASTLIGMIAGNVVSKVVVPQSNYIEAQLGAISAAQMKYTSLMNEENNELSPDDIEVEGDEGFIEYSKLESWGSDSDIEIAQNEDNSLDNDFSYAFNERLGETFSTSVN